MRKLQAICVAVSLAFGSPADAKPKKADCNPQGFENQIIACLHNANIDKSALLKKHYQKHIDLIFDTCALNNPGGGSAGFSDRAQCAMKALDEEAKRVKLKTQ